MAKSSSVYKKFGRITNYNYKNNDLVVNLSMGSFFYIKKSFFVDIDMYIVPPEIDEPRIINIDCINSFSKNFNIVSLHMTNNLYINSKDFLIDRFLMIEKSVYLKLLNTFNQEYVANFNNLAVIDKYKGIIGYVCSIEGNTLQKHLVVAAINDNSKKILIPYVKEIVYKVENDAVYVDMPKGLENL